MQAADESEFLYHTTCPDCGSSDANGVYDDGHEHCFSCGRHTPPTGEAPPPEQPNKRIVAGLIDPGSARELKARHIREDTCRKWGYTVSEMDGETVQVANYRDHSGAIVAQKVRSKGKDFKFIGDAKSAGLYGAHLWRDGGKRIIITEGEVDALSVSQALGNTWPVVSVPNGAQGARKSLAKSLEWLNTFGKIVLCFDNDEPGHKATADCVGLFPPGKVQTVSLPLKDPNEMLKAERLKELVTALWEARDYRPDGIVSLSDIKDKALVPPARGLAWFLPEIDDLTYGRRLGECVALGAGTGIGKTDVIMEQIAYDLTVLKQNVGLFALEQLPQESAQRIAGKVASKRFHVPDGSWTVDELRGALETVEESATLYLYDHFGSADWDVIKERIRFLHHSEGVNIFYLDHLTALATAEEDERTGLERIMAELGGLVKELNIWLLFVSHLATPEGKSHEEGGRVTIRQFKGSRAIGYWSVFMFGLERDQQSSDEDLRHITTFRVLKDRLTGQATGKTVALDYDATTGRISAVTQEDNEDDAEVF